MKFHLVSYTRKLINLSKQLGHPIDDTGIEDGMLYKQEMPTKFKAGERPLPDFVIEESMIFFRLSHQKLMHC